MKTLLAVILSTMFAIAAQAQDISSLIITLPETGSTNGWDYLPSQQFTGEMLAQLYADGRTSTNVIESCVTGYTNELGQPVHVFCDSVQNILGDRVKWDNYVPFLLSQLTPQIIDPTCRWGIHLNPQAWLRENDITPVPVEDVP